MIETKNLLGKKIRILREEKGFTREKLCGDELDLTIRQLARIEQGQSLPTLPKLKFLSKRLTVQISTLIDESEGNFVELPERYLQLKYLIVRNGIYRDKKRVTKRDDYFKEIYTNYYDKIPEEEQLAIDTQRASMMTFVTGELDPGEQILEDYFFQLRKKTVYSINDLLLIHLFLNRETVKVKKNMSFDGVTVNFFIENTMNQINNSIDLELFLEMKLLIIVAGIYCDTKQYAELRRIVDKCTLIMQKSQEFLKKPIIDMLEGKYLLFFKKQVTEAKAKYEQAASFAEMIEDFYVKENIMNEWEKDIKVFNEEESD